MPFGGLLTAGIGVGTSLLGGLFGSNAAQQAAAQQAAADQKAINFLQNEQQTGMQNYQPYLDAGGSATKTLASLLGTPGSGLLTPWTGAFTAPTAAEAAATPGYQFQLGQGLSAAQNSAAGRGSLLSGRTLADLNNYAQGTASTNYQNTFNNALTQYNSAYQSFLNNQNAQYSRLMGLSGEGLTAAQGAGTLLSQLGGDTASMMGAKGAAQAAGTIGAANAWSGAMSGIDNSVMGGMTLGSLNGTGMFGGGLPAADSTSFDSSLWMGTPSYMPGGGPSPTPPFSGLTLQPGSFGSMPGFAFGTDYAPGGPAMVGEAGPEMVNLPRGSQVIPNYQLANLNGASPMRPIGNPLPYRPIPEPSPVAPGFDPRMMPPVRSPIWGAQPPRAIDPRMMPPDFDRGMSPNFPMWGAQPPRGFALSALA